MNALILASESAMAKIHGRPVLSHILDRVDGLVDSCYVAVDNKFSMDFKELYGSRVDIIEDRGFIDNLRFVRRDTGLFVIDGGNYFDFDLNEMVELYKKKREGTVVALYDVGSREKAKGFSVPIFKRNKYLVVGMIEKPLAPENSWVDCSIYLLSKFYFI